MKQYKSGNELEISFSDGNVIQSLDIEWDGYSDGVTIPRMLSLPQAPTGKLRCRVPSRASPSGVEHQHQSPTLLLHCLVAYASLVQCGE